MSGMEMAHTIGQSQRFNPPLDTAIPPKIPPKVNPIIPTVPCTKPICSVVKPKPPSLIGSTKKGMLILAN